MANTQFVRENRISKEMAQEKSEYLKKVIILAVPLVLILIAIYPAGILLWAGILLVAVFPAFKTDHIKKSGAAGEDYTLSVLKRLPAEYTIFNQLEVPDERSRTGTREMDFVVCGPNGIFVIESKSHNGMVAGHEDDQRWTIHKVGRGGTAYSDSIRNPVRQVKQQVHVLSAHLKTKNINEWVTGVVTLSSDNSLENITSNTVSVVQSSTIADYIMSYNGRSKPRYLKQVVDALSGLICQDHLVASRKAA